MDINLGNVRGSSYANLVSHDYDYISVLFLATFSQNIKYYIILLKSLQLN